MDLEINIGLDIYLVYLNASMGIEINLDLYIEYISQYILAIVKNVVHV